PTNNTRDVSRNLPPACFDRGTPSGQCWCKWQDPDTCQCSCATPAVTYQPAQTAPAPSNSAAMANASAAGAGTLPERFPAAPVEAQAWHCEAPALNARPNNSATCFPKPTSSSATET